MESRLDTTTTTLPQAEFTPTTLISGRGILHMLQIIFSVVIFVLSALRFTSSFSYWIYAMFTWAFCPVVTLIITAIEMFKLDVRFNMFYMDWPDFTTGMAMTSSLMTLSAAIIYANFYLCVSCFYAWVETAFAFLCAVAYLVEVLWDKILEKKKGSYLAALPGFWKVMEAFVSCVIFISLTGYHGMPALIACIVAYVIPFPIILMIIVVNIFKKLRYRLPFNQDRFVFIFLIISVVLYVFTAIAWPTFTFRGNPRPDGCLPSCCIWAIEFVVAFMTFVNLSLFGVDLVFTLFGICGFQRG